MKRPFHKESFVLLLFILLVATEGCNYNTAVKKEKPDTAAESDPVVNDALNKAISDSIQLALTSETADNTWLLVPGKSAGLTHLNENAEETYKRLRPPDGGDAAMQKAIAIWYTNHDSTNHSLSIYTAREPGVDPIAQILQIRITSPTFKTAEGIGPGNSLAQIQKAFTVTQTEQYKDEGTLYKVYDSPQGIAFETDPNQRCVAVVIHAAGITGQGTYLQFRTTNKFISRNKE